MFVALSWVAVAEVVAGMLVAGVVGIASFDVALHHVVERVAVAEGS